ncbi:universal stress protein [Kitasatospora sp. NPDC127067]|uniref:universal stress protein n=1 Tax=Kitasatospora sp. NPDC127067 TaxID=3347126 RepID=UPI00365210CF
MGEEPRRSARIVVGVDGSPTSRSALTWAARQAGLTGDSVDAVIAWQYPVGYGAPSAAVPNFDFAGNARQALAGAVTEAAAESPQVEIRQHVVQGHPAAALLEAAESADPLVVGNRGHGGFTEALLGSVSQHCVHHAPCPVVVVRAARPRPQAEP